MNPNKPMKTKGMSMNKGYMDKGWYNDPMEHSLASQGISSGRKHPQTGPYQPNESGFFDVMKKKTKQQKVKTDEDDVYKYFLDKSDTTMDRDYILDKGKSKKTMEYLGIGRMD